MNSPEEDNLNTDQINQENINIKENIIDEQSLQSEDKYQFGWGSYSEITNGRFAMLGFLAIILIELFSHQSFLKWAGII